MIAEHKPARSRLIDWILTEDADAIPPDVSDHAGTGCICCGADAERDHVTTAGDLKIVVSKRHQTGLNEVETFGKCRIRLKFKDFIKAVELRLLAVLAFGIEENLVEHAIKNGFALRFPEPGGLVRKTF